MFLWIAFGFSFPHIAWLMDIIFSGLTLPTATIIQFHQNNPIYYSVDLTPLVLGTVLYFLDRENEQTAY